jgi:hypothetical protein
VTWCEPYIVLPSYMSSLSSMVVFWSGLPSLLTVVGVKYMDLLHTYLDCSDGGSEYVNITWVHAGQNRVHFQGKCVPFF